jgi:gas vesicle protein
MSYDELDDRHGGASFLLGFIAGSVLGAGLALLLAPRSGEEIRREMAERAERLSKRAASEYEAASARVTHLAERGKDAYRTAADKARKYAERGRDDAHDLAEQAHEAVEDVRERVDAGVKTAKADLRDLQDRRS